MQKQEFEERIERTVTDEQYKVIEEVYMWHPSIRNTSGKDEVAELYKSFGMTIFHETQISFRHGNEYAIAKWFGQIPVTTDHKLKLGIQDKNLYIFDKADGKVIAC